MRTAIVCLSALLSLVVLSHDVSAQNPWSDAYVLEMGSDTLAVERFDVSPGKLEGEIIGHAFGRTIYEVSHSGGLVTDVTLQSWRPGSFEDAPAQTAVIRMEGDSVFVKLSSSAGSVDQAFATKVGAVPYLNPSVAMLELANQLAGEFDSTVIPLFLLQGGVTLDAQVTRTSRDSLQFVIAASTVILVSDDDGVIREGSIPAQNIRIARDPGAGFPLDATSAPDYSAPSDASYIAESVEVVARSGHRLAGTLTRPERDGRLPAVVTITGSGPQDRDQAIPGLAGYRPFRDIADALTRRGIAVLRLDDRGVGESTGDFNAATSKDFADDVRDAVAYLKTRADIDSDRIALVGHSEGGLIAPMIAATDTSLAGIVLLAGPAQTGREIIRHQIRAAATDAAGDLDPAAIDSLVLAQHAEIDAMAYGSPWMRFFLDYDPLATARKVRSVPVLIVHGETDVQVTSDQAQTLATAFREGGNPEVEVVLLPDVNHLLLHDSDGHPARYTTLVDRTVVSEALEAVGRWLESRLLSGTATGVDRK